MLTALPVGECRRAAGPTAFLVEPGVEAPTNEPQPREAAALDGSVCSGDVVSK